MDFVVETGALIVDYELPSPEDFPTLKAVKYDVVRETFEQSYWSASEVAQFYESAMYQSCLRSLYDVFAADEAEVIASVTFNGWVNFTDKAHGKPARACIMSVQAARTTIEHANLWTVDPKTCFKALKGVAGARLADMTAVVPILPLKRTDSRFVPANDVTVKDAIGRPLTPPGSQDRA
jgi:restriction system protein